MKKILVAFSLAMTLASFAEPVTCTWTGNGDGTSWSDVGNWDASGVPVTGAIVDLSAAVGGATLNNDLSNLSLVRISASGANGFSLTGNAVTLTGDVSVDVAPSSGTTYTLGLPLVLGAVTNAVRLTSAGRLDITGVISGSGALSVALAAAAAELHLGGANTYTGGTLLDLQPGKVYAEHAQAFGAGTAESLGDVHVRTLNTNSKLYVSSSAAYCYNLRFLADGTGAQLVWLVNNGIWQGGIYRADAFTFDLHANGVNYRSFKVAGPVEMSQTALRLAPGYQAYVRFGGALNVKSIAESASLTSSYSGALNLMATGNSYEKIELGYYGMVKCDADQALSPTGGISCDGSCSWTCPDRWTNGSLYLNGHDQTVAYLEGGTWPQTHAAGHIYSGVLASSSLSRGSQAATLTIRGSKSATSGYLLDDKVSLVYDALDSSYVQTFTRRTHLTTGSVTVSNGTVSVTGTATFKNLSAITVEDGACFSLESTEDLALQQLATLTVRGAGRFEIADGVAQPFDPETLAIRLDENARIRIPSGMTLNVDQLWIGDNRIAGGQTYSGLVQIEGGGSIRVKVWDIVATWTGAGDGTRWSDEANWDAAGKPSTDALVILGGVASGAAITNDLTGLSIRRIDSTGADSFTLEGNELTLTDPISIKVSPASGNVQTYTLPLVLGAETNAVSHLSAGRLDLTGVISGSGVLNVSLADTAANVHLGGANTYTGGTLLDLQKGKVYADHAQAFGAGSAESLGDVCLSAGKESDTRIYLTKATTYPYNLRILDGGTGADLVWRASGVTWQGGIYRSGAFSLRVHADGGNNTPLTVSGPVEMPLSSLKSAPGYLAYIRFEAPLNVKSITESAPIGSNYSGALNLRATGNRYEKIELGYYGMVKCDADQALSPTGGITDDDNDSYEWDANGRWTNGSLYLNGHDQTVAYLSGGKWSKTSTSGHIFSGVLASSSASRGSEAATLTIRGSQSATTGYLLDDKTSLVYDALDSSYVQTFTRRAHLTTESVTVSNGTVSVTGTATFQKLSAITVEDGACFSLESTEDLALQKLGNLTVRGEGRFEIADGVSAPFQPESVVLKLDENARIRIPGDMSLSVAELWIGDELQDGGKTYADLDQITGGGSIVTKSVEVPTVSATWNGSGADDRVSTLENWTPTVTLEDLTSGGLQPTFATGGAEAIVDRQMKVKALLFGGDGSVSSFLLRPEGSSAGIELNAGGLTVAADEAARAYTNAVPMTIRGAQTWCVDGAQTTCRLSAPLTTAVSYDITKTGTGNLELAATNADLTAVWTVSAGKLTLNATSNALGRAHGTASCTVGEAGTLVLGGCVEEMPLLVQGKGSGSHSIWSQPDTTNVLLGQFENSTFDISMRLDSGSETRIDGFFDQKYNVYLSGSGTLRLAGAVKLGYIQVQGSTLVLDSPSVDVWSGGAYRLVLTSGGRIVCARPNQFSAKVHCLRFMYAGGTFDLQGHDQFVGSLETDYCTAGTITSATPATLTLRTTMETNSVIDVTGAVSCRKTGDTSLYFNRAIRTTGSLAVTAGTVGFTEKGTWRDGASANVSGTGRLVIGKSKTFGRACAFTVTDSGVIELAAGVNQKCAELSIGGVRQSTGTYGATGSGAAHVDDVHFAGRGVLRVGSTGATIVIR